MSEGYGLEPAVEMVLPVPDVSGSMNTYLVLEISDIPSSFVMPA